MQKGDVTLVRMLDRHLKFLGWCLAEVVLRSDFMVGLRLPSGKVYGVDLDELRTWGGPRMVLNTTKEQFDGETGSH